MPVKWRYSYCVMEKWVEFRRIFIKSRWLPWLPLFYIFWCFGLGIQTMSHGQSYLNFLIPGVVALTTMNGSFNAIAQNLNVQRLYEKHLTRSSSLLPRCGSSSRDRSSAEVSGDYMREPWLFFWFCRSERGLCFNGWSFLLMFLNGSVFSTIGVVVSFMPKPCRCAALFELRDYADGISGNTFFQPGMPDGLRQVIEYLPLSQTSAALRSIANHEVFSYTTIGILLLYLACFRLLRPGFCIRKEFINTG